MADISKISPDAGTTEYNVKDATARSDIASIVEKIPVNASSSNKFATEADIASAYHAAGTKTVAELLSSLLVAANEGNVYNMTDAGTTTADFIEGAGKPIRIGDNVGVCKVGNDYKFDLLSGFIDTSNFVEKSSTSGLLKNDGTVDTTSYVEAETGKGLSTNDYDATAKGIVDSIPLTVSQLQGSLLEKFPRSEQIELGAWNILPIGYNSFTRTGITATKNADGSLTLNGTPSSAIAYMPINTTDFNYNGVLIKAGTTFVPSTGNSNYKFLFRYSDGTYQSELNNNEPFTPSKDISFAYVAINGQVSDVLLKPMISFEPSLFAPYAMTNRELTEKVSDGWTSPVQLLSSTTYVSLFY